MAFHLLAIMYFLLWVHYALFFLSIITKIDHQHLLLTSNNVIIKFWCFVCGSFPMASRATNFIQLAWNFFFSIFAFHICSFHIWTELGILDLWIKVMCSCAWCMLCTCVCSHRPMYTCRPEVNVLHCSPFPSF